MKRQVIAAAAVALVLGACGGPREVTIGGMSAESGSNATAAKTVKRPWGTVKAFPELRKAEPPSQADVVFASDMVHHHEQAMELSTNLLAHDGLEERVKASASFILKDQKNEIGVMNSWLEAWRSSLGDLAGHGDHDASTMPGMLPQERVDEIASLSSADAQVAFLVAMVEHHEGAVEMSRDYLHEQQNSFTLSTAQHIIREQNVEITYMENVIDDLCADDGPPSCPTS